MIFPYLIGFVTGIWVGYGLLYLRAPWLERLPQRYN